MTTYNLPLFPLNSVLFPGVPIFLHIFEERYKLMVNRCISQRKPFGVVLILEGVEAGGSAEPCAVGCSAEIVKVERLPDGRMNIVAVGQDRFRIVDTNQQQLYLQGEVESFPLEASQGLQPLATRLRAHLEAYIDILSEMDAVQIRVNEGLPDDPVDLGYLAAYVLQVSAELKQKILEQPSAHEMLRMLEMQYATELSLLRAYNPDSGTIFSLN
jgi:Lon protease-like protein